MSLPAEKDANFIRLEMYIPIGHLRGCEMDYSKLNFEMNFFGNKNEQVYKIDLSKDDFFYKKTSKAIVLASLVKHSSTDEHSHVLEAGVYSNA